MIIWYQILIIAIVGCWIGEWSKLIQKLAWFTNQKWINWLGCAKCWAFWLGFFDQYQYNFVQAIICSALAMIMNKIYMRL